MNLFDVPTMSSDKTRERKLCSNRKAARKCRAKKRLYTRSLEGLSSVVTRLLNSGYDGAYADDLVDIMTQVRENRKAGKRGRPRKQDVAAENLEELDEGGLKEEEMCDDVAEKGDCALFWQTEVLSFII